MRHMRTIHPGLWARGNLKCSHGYAHKPQNCPECSERKRLIRLMLAVKRWHYRTFATVDRAQREMLAALEPFLSKEPTR